MQCVVTGGAGFIGSHITRTLIEEDHTVVCVDNLSTGNIDRVPKECKFYETDISDGNIFRDNDIDLVIHCAAQADVATSVADPALDAEENIVKTLKLLKNMEFWGVKRIIFLSTGGALYGDGGNIPSKEDAPKMPESPYGIAKLTVEKYLQFYEDIHGFEVSILRLANVYGSGNKKGVISIFDDRLKAGRIIDVYGGEQTRDYVHVSDVVEAVKLMFHNEGTYNVGTGAEVSVIQLAQMIADKYEVTLMDCVNILPAKPGEVLRSCLCSDKLKTLGWKAKVGLKEGIIN